MHHSSPRTQRASDSPLALNEMTKQYIEDIIEMTDGKIHGKRGAADILGINANTLRNRKNKLNINYKN